MRAQALFSVLSKKLKDNEILFVDSFSLSEIKTKKAVEVMKNLTKAGGFKSLATSKSKKPKILVALYGRNEKAEKSFRNIPALEIVFLKNLNPLDVLNHQYLLMENPAEAVKFLESRGT
jgi:large subunit ribosomal protein L4